MRKMRFLLCMTFSLFVNSIFSQTTGNFNYQAVVRDADGELITNQSLSVQLSIIESTADGNEIYKETHSVTSSKTGLINLLVGNGTSNLGDFATINWGESSKFIKIKIDAGNSFVDMGTFQLFSVPYAHYANSSETANTANIAEVLGSDGVYSTSSDTLFVVKDHSGNVVFAVFPDGAQVIVNETAKGKVGGFAISGRSPSKAGDVDIFRATVDSTRIYVSDTISSKGKVGGFAISGRSPSKGVGNDYLVITGDSTRIYINDTLATKGKVGGFAISGRSPSKGPTNDYLQINRDSTRIYITESTTKGKVGGFAISGRSPSKAGTVVEKDYFNITANTTAEKIKNESRIMWYPEKSAFMTGEVHVGSSDSVGTNSTALGFQNIAMGAWSQAFGFKSKALGTYSTAIGNEAEAEMNSLAVGYQAKATGNSSYAMGYGAEALGDNSYALGSIGLDSAGVVTNNTQSIGAYSFAFGLGSVSTGKGAVAFGTGNEAIGEYSTAIGYKNKATKWFATSMGGNSEATGIFSTAIGFYTSATNVASTAFGYGSDATGYSSFAVGFNSSASGHASIAMGDGAEATGGNSAAIGNNTHALGTNVFVTGTNTTAQGQGSFVFGDGSSTNAGGTYSIAGGFGCTANGAASTSLGASNAASGYVSAAFGQSTIASGQHSLSLGFDTNATGNLSISAGNTTTAQAYASLVIGRNNLITGSITNWNGTDPLFVAGNGTNADNKANAMTLLKNGNLTIAGVYLTSDIKLKEKIETLNKVLPIIKNITPIYFGFKNKEIYPSNRQIGFSAQEIQKYFPEMVLEGQNGMLAVDYSKMTVVLLQAINEQQDMIQKQQEENQLLKDQILDINTKLDMLLSK